MQNHMALNRNELEDAISKAHAFLLSCQDQDGFWRDYSLPPGSSEAWTTACVGWLLASSGNRQNFMSGLNNAANALHSIRRAKGWGYNRKTATDADSTAWTWRFLAKMDNYFARDAAATLTQYLSTSGAVRTFLDIERFGSWAWEHPDVTPVVGMALIAVKAERSFVNRVRRACLDIWKANGIWPSFWWATDSYSMARNLEFLSESGGIPSNVIRSSWEWLIRLEEPSSPFEAANNLMAAITLGKTQTDFSTHQVMVLLKWQLNDNSWPPSPVLLVPDQRNGIIGKCTPYEDPMRLMSTAMAAYALNLYLLT